MHWKKYIENLEDEIDRSVEEEAECLSIQGELELNVLLKNLKLAKECMEEKRSKQDGAQSKSLY